MASTRVRAWDLPRSHTGERVAPTRPDGMPWRFELRRGGVVVYGDGAGDVLEQLLPGYLQRDPTERARCRVEHATAAATQLQVQALAPVRVGEVAVTPDELVELLRSRREPTQASTWGATVPLVLLAVHYAPYTDLPVPDSTLDPGAVEPRNIVWLRPGHEEAYVLSLARAGAIDLAEHAAAS